MLSILGKIDAAVRISLGFLAIALVSIPFILLFLLLLPSRILRVKASYYYIRALAAIGLLMTRTKLIVNHRRRLTQKFPAIYLINHASAFDLFVVCAVLPIRAVGIAKKEIVYIPFFGQVALLSGHLLINRRRHASTVEALNKTAEEAKKYGLGIGIAPEGTRSEDGRLLPFKKGFAHLALATRYPLVPIVIHNAHKKWPKHGKLSVRRWEQEVDILEPIDTEGWRLESLDEHIADTRSAFAESLGPEQKPLD